MIRDYVSPRDLTAFDYIKAYSAHYHIPPAQSLIAKRVGLHPQNNRGVGKILNRLVHAGLIRRVPGRHYGIELIEPQNDNASNCPHCGRARAAQ